MLDAGSLVVLPFPFSDLRATKRRPVLLLTAPDGYGDFLAMAVTSQAGDRPPLCQDRCRLLFEELCTVAGVPICLR